MRVTLLRHVDQEVVLGCTDGGGVGVGVEAAVQEASFSIGRPVKRRE